MLHCIKHRVFSFIRITGKAMITMWLLLGQLLRFSLILASGQFVCLMGMTMNTQKPLLGATKSDLFSRQDQFVNRYVDAAGWGTLSFGGSASNVLQKVTLQVISNNDCARFYGNRITVGLMCTYMPNRDACQVLFPYPHSLGMELNTIKVLFSIFTARLWWTFVP